MTSFNSEFSHTTQIHSFCQLILCTLFFVMSISLLQLQRENCKKRQEESYNLYLSGDGKIADRKNNRRNKTDDYSWINRQYWKVMYFFLNDIVVWPTNVDS